MKKKYSAFSLVELSIVILVVGIIIAGVSTGMSLVTKMRLASARTLTQNGTIPSISGLTLWLDASSKDAFGSELQDGDTVSIWYDMNPRSVNKINPSQATANLQPDYVEDGIGGLPSLQFNQAEYLLALTSSGSEVPLGAGDDTYTMVAVWRSDAARTSVVMEQNSSTLISGARASFSTTNTGYGFAGEGISMKTCSYKSAINYASLITINDGTANIYSNSTSAPSGTCTGTFDASIGSVATGGFYIGVKGSTLTGEKFQGLISELMVFDRVLSSSEITEVMNYLGKKYRITL